MLLTALLRVHHAGAVDLVRRDVKLAHGPYATVCLQYDFLMICTIVKDML